MLKRGWIYAWGVVLFVGLPGWAWANGGTPLMWVRFQHLLLGNLLIGVGEGLLLAQCFGLVRGKSIWVMILANYFSAWVGFLLLRGVIAHAVPMDLNNGRVWFWIMVAVMYVMTIVLEWPFVAWVMKRRPRRMRDAWKASLLVQTASYVLVFGVYLDVSRLTLYKNADVVAPQELALPAEVQVYYIGAEDGAVYRRGLTESVGRKVYELHSESTDDRMIARPVDPNSNCWALLACLHMEDANQGKLVTVLTSQTLASVAVWPGDKWDGKSDQHVGTWLNSGDAAQLGNATNEAWKFEAGKWLTGWLSAREKTTGKRLLLEWETPFVFWYVRNLVRLPNGMALFQLGWDQICVFDAATRRVALLWHGRGPLPVIAVGKGAVKK